MNSKRLVVAGHYGPAGDEIMVDKDFADTFQPGAADAIDAMPEQLDFCDSFELGRLDALDNRPCHPGQYDRLTEQCCYALGWRSVAGDNTTTLALLEPKPSPAQLFGQMLTCMMDEDAHIEDTLAYEDDIEEREFIRFGGA